MSSIDTLQIEMLCPDHCRTPPIRCENKSLHWAYCIQEAIDPDMNVATVDRTNPLGLHSLSVSRTNMGAVVRISQVSEQKENQNSAPWMHLFDEIIHVLKFDFHNDPLSKFYMFSVIHLSRELDKKTATCAHPKETVNHFEISSIWERYRLCRQTISISSEVAVHRSITVIRCKSNTYA